MNSLDALSMTGTELTPEQLDDVDGGAVALAVALIVSAAYLAWWYANRPD